MSWFLFVSLNILNPKLFPPISRQIPLFNHPAPDRLPQWPNHQKISPKNTLDSPRKLARFRKIKTPKKARSINETRPCHSLYNAAFNPPATKIGYTSIEHPALINTQNSKNRSIYRKPPSHNQETDRYPWHTPKNVKNHWHYHNQNVNFNNRTKQSFFCASARLTLEITFFSPINRALHRR